MTTVILTKTHIACDHSRMEMDMFTEIVVDPDHKKIFINNAKTFIVAVEGIYDPAVIDNEETMQWFKSIYDKTINESLLMVHDFTDKEILDQYDTLFHKEERFIIVTKDQRFLYKRNREEKYLSVVRLGNVAGIGSGGRIAIGMIHGGMDVFSIWDKLSDRNDWTSKEHTVFDLDILQEYT